jgi:hypothetical protein
LPLVPAASYRSCITSERLTLHADRQEANADACVRRGGKAALAPWCSATLTPVSHREHPSTEAACPVQTDMWSKPGKRWLRYRPPRTAAADWPAGKPLMMRCSLGRRTENTVPERSHISHMQSLPATWRSMSRPADGGAIERTFAAGRPRSAEPGMAGTLGPQRHLPHSTFLFTLKFPMRFSASTTGLVGRDFHLLDVRYPQVYRTQPGGANRRLRGGKRAGQGRNAVRRQATFSPLRGKCKRGGTGGRFDA